MSGAPSPRGRRRVVRVGIPPHIPIPKFMSSAEIERVRRLKRSSPALTWADAIAEVVQRTKAR